MSESFGYLRLKRTQMNDQARRKFLMMLGKSAGALFDSADVLASIGMQEEVLQLEPEQKEFMLMYGKWMDEMAAVVKLQKEHPEQIEHRKRMMELSEIAREWQDTLNEYMKEKKFALIYHASITHMQSLID